MAEPPIPAAKTCERCGRPFEWRRKWARTWDRVRYCSERCRRSRGAPIESELEESILALLAHTVGTICPSQAARRVDPEAWRDLMERARAAGRRLAARERVVVLQRGRAVDPATARGPIRYGRGRRFGEP